MAFFVYLSASLFVRNVRMPQIHVFQLDDVVLCCCIANFKTILQFIIHSIQIGEPYII